MTEIPDHPPTDDESKKMLRYSVELIPDVMVQQQFESWDEEKGKMVTRARGTTHHFSLGHNFIVHIEHGFKFQTAKEDEDSIVRWTLKQQSFLTMIKAGVNPEMLSPELGVIKVSVPRYCKEDEARKKVVLAVRAMIDAVNQ